MKKLIWIIILAIFGLIIFSLGFYFQDFSLMFHKKKILAQVNGTEITDLDMKREIAFLKVSENANFSESTREDLLDRMVNDTLILQEARRLNLTIPEALVNSRLAAAGAGYSNEETKKIFSEVGLNANRWHHLIGRQLLIEVTVQKVVEDLVRVGEDEIDAYYWAHAGDFYRPPRVHARQIVVETAEQARDIKGKLDRGEEFQALARKFSRGPERDLGGDLDWVTEMDLPRSFSQALFRLKPGEISEPIATQYGFHLFRVEEADKGGKIPVEEAKHKIAEDLKTEKSDQAFQAWIEELRNKAKITIKDVRGGE
jgi:parvulin-like peptidyl-prolyl isomerase